MTPEYLLKEVIDRFVLLHVQDEDKQKRMLYASIGAYQDKAGYVKTISSDNHVIAIPDDSDGLFSIADKDGLMPDFETSETEWTVSSCEKAPFKVQYLVDLRGINYETGEIPSGTASLISDHLYASLDLVNTQIDRMIKQSAELPFDSLRSDAELIQARADVELRMQEDSSLNMMVSV